MKNYFDFSGYIRQIQKEPYADISSQFLHLVFLSFQAGASNNDPMILNKSQYFINQIQNAYLQKNISLQEIQQLYDGFINGNKRIDQEVPDVTFESEFYIDSSSSIFSQIEKKLDLQLENPNIKQQKEEPQQEIKREAIKEENKKKISIQEVKQGNLAAEEDQRLNAELQNQNRQIDNSLIQDNQKQIDIQIPKIKDIYLMSIDQSQKVKQQQYEEYRKKESEKSMIFSQRNQRRQNYQNTQCNICLEQIQSNKYVLMACQHIFHKQCLENLIKAQADLPIRCPNFECKQEILRDDLENITTKQIMDKLDKFAFNQYLLRNPNIFQCPTQNCKGVYEIEGFTQVCMICQQIFCTKCKKQYHEGICGEQSFVKVAKEQNYSQCSSCKRWIEKTFGCNHISCPCGYEFCYVCGKQWQKGQECRCIYLLPHNQQQQQQQQQQQRQRISQNQTRAQQIQDGFNLIQLLANNNNNHNIQNQYGQYNNALQGLGLTYILRILRDYN
ncbi:unnamed protein product [Paramecium sonneborni]|uniref:RBR-type E3 ubiquitin transferase n=1 Tax=Paramecium sonneborni TaxID=65129 RepID=A0A8S1L7L8_9CILI|nr:unnamed protein product [Paramecium sonneborni]